MYSRFLTLLLALISSITLTNFLSSCTTEKEPVSPPNILIAIADDASFPHMGAYGTDWINTPAFDRVAKEGILFMNCYTPNAKCAPSRSCILTGRNSWQLEEAANHWPYFPEKFKTYVEALGDNGYFVGYTAKGWAPGKPGEREGKLRELTGLAFNNRKIEIPAKHINANDYAGNFEDFLNQKPADQPFCFWYGSTEPHRAYEFRAGVNYGNKNPDQIKEIPPFWPQVDSIKLDMLDYAFEIEWFDQHLHKMLKLLEDNGELNNTIVLVTSDNGMPFPRIKGQVYEYSNHLPLAIMWKNGIQNPGRKINDYVNFIDLAPTFLEIAGIREDESGMQPIQGASLTDIFNSKKEGIVSPERNYILVGKEKHDVGRPGDVGYPVRGIVKDGFLYLKNFKTDRWPAGNPETGYLNTDGSPTKTVILNERRNRGDRYFWDLNFGKRTDEELYNIIDDPFCMNNLALNISYTEKRKIMENELVEKLSAQKDPRIIGNGDIFDTYLYANDNDRNFYERYLSGESINADWVNETDFETEVIE